MRTLWRFKERDESITIPYQRSIFGGGHVNIEDLTPPAEGEAGQENMSEDRGNPHLDLNDEEIAWAKELGIENIDEVREVVKKHEASLYRVR